MHLAIPFTLLMGSYVAAAPSIQHAQISVKITNIDAQNQVDALHSSEELVKNQDGSGLKSLPFNFTLSARYADGPASLPFGFENLDAPDGLIRGELGVITVFAFREGKLIYGNRALGPHLVEIFPPWTSLWTLKGENDGTFFDLIVTSQDSGGSPNYFLELARSDQTFGALEIKRGQPVFVGPPVVKDFKRTRILLAVEPIRKPSYDINAESSEELL